MKRYKVWLKEKLNTEKYHRETNELKTKTTFGELYDRGVSDGINVALEFVDQLDEPEVLSQEWIDEHAIGDWDEYVYADDLQNLLAPKQDKPESECNPMNLKIKRLTETAKLPERAFPTEAGLDVFADEDVTIHNGETVAVSTGIALEIPDGYYGRLKARSGLTLKSDLRVQEGTIDSSFRGEIKIIAEIKALNYDETERSFYQTMPTRPFAIEKGMKLAQLIIQPLPYFEVVEVDELSQSDRGENGFGSTGV